MNFDKRTPGSEKNNEADNRPNLERDQFEQDKEQVFRDASKAQAEKNTGIESRKQLTKLGKEVLHSTVEYQKSQKKTPDYVEKMKENFIPNNSREKSTDYIASAENAPENQNSISAISSSLVYSGKSVIIKLPGIIVDAFKIKDHKDLITGKAEHEGIKNA